MANKQPIRIGDTFHRTYKFYEPLAGSSPPKPDYTKPILYDDATISFVVRNGAYVYEFGNTEANPNVITIAAHVVDVDLTNTQTEVFTEGTDGKDTSHLKVIISGKEYTKAIRAERIVRQTTR